MSRVLPQTVEMSKNTRTPFAFSSYLLVFSSKETEQELWVGMSMSPHRRLTGFFQNKSILKAA